MAEELGAALTELEAGGRGSPDTEPCYVLRV